MAALSLASILNVGNMQEISFANFFDFLSNFVHLLHIKQINIDVMAYKISEECIACGTCIDECPVEAISEGDIYKIDADLCTDCGSCAEVCPVDAIAIAE